MRDSSNAIRVRDAKERDLPQVVRLFRKVLLGIPYYNTLAKSSERRKWGLSTLRSKLRYDKHSVMVAEDSSGIIGFVFNRFDDYLIWIEWFGVDQDARREGVGSALI